MDPISNIQAFNHGREPERLQMKYEKMSESAFAFLRGTCHLFYDKLPAHPIFETAPKVWCCGDLHLENYGSYKGGNRQVYFDINDFEESVLAPASWDLVRMLTSIRVAAQDKNMKPAKAAELCTAFLGCYQSELGKGKALWVERRTADGLVEALFEKLETRTRPKFLNDRTSTERGVRRLRIDATDDKKKKMLAISPDNRSAVETALRSFASNKEKPEFFDVLDVARRVAGTGSLGLGRFVVLVKGEGSPDGNYLLDLKQSSRSSLLTHLGAVRQPVWASESERIVELQRRMQAITAAHLNPLQIGGKWYVLRELQPTDDSVEFNPDKQGFEKVEKLLQTMGRIVAWSQLRSAGREGSANADGLIAFAATPGWREALLQLSESCAADVRRDAEIFNKAYKQKVFAQA